MITNKDDGFTLWSAYTLHLEIGLVLSLLILVLAFQFTMTPRQEFDVRLEKQEVVQMEDIQPTEQKAQAPAPPAPSVPVEVPNDYVLEQEPIDLDASLDLDETLDVGQDSAASGPPDGYVERDLEEEDEDDDEEIFVAVETSPDCGGVPAIQENVEYPRVARQSGLEGTVYVEFVVDETGAVSSPRILKGVHPMLNKEAIKAVERLVCTPGRQRDKPVKVQLTLPVRFALGEK